MSPESVPGISMSPESARAESAVPRVQVKLDKKAPDRVELNRGLVDFIITLGSLAARELSLIGGRSPPYLAKRTTLCPA